MDFIWLVVTTRSMVDQRGVTDKVKSTGRWVLKKKVKIFHVLQLKDRNYYMVSTYYR